MLLTLICCPQAKHVLRGMLCQSIDNAAEVINWCLFYWFVSTQELLLGSTESVHFMTVMLPFNYSL